MDIATLGLEIKSDGVAVATDRLKKFEGQAGKAEDRASAFTAAMRALTPVLATIGAAFGVQQLVKYADAWSDMQSRVGAAVKSMEAAPALMKRMVDLANASYSPLEQTVEVYTRNVGVLRDLGYAADGAADFTEALNHALVITATRGERAASVQNALSKAMATGKLAGDGLETVLSNGGRVAEVLAAQLGTTVSGLRQMATDGKITGQVIAQALTGSLEQLRAEAAEMPATIGDAFTRIQNNTTALIGTLDQAWGISGRVAEQMLAFADGILVAADVMLRLGNIAGAVFGPAFDAIGASLDTVTQLAGVAIAGLAGFYAPVLIGGIGALVTSLSAGLLPALGAVATAIKGIGIAMLANPLGLLIGGLAAAVTAAFLFRDEIKQVIGIDVVEVFDTGANWIIGAMVGAVKAVMAAWDVLPGFMKTLGMQAWNAFLSGFEGSAVTWTNPFTGEVFDLIKLDLTNFKYDIEGEAADIGKAVKDAYDSAQGINYTQGMRDALGTLWETADGASDAITGLAGAFGGGSGSGGLSGAAAKAADEYVKLVQSARSFIEQQENERKALGMSEEQANALRYSYDLLNKAKEGGLKLTGDQVAELTALGQQMAAAEAETKRLTKAFADQQQAVDDILGTVGDAFGKLFDGTIKDFDGFIDHILNGFAKLGQNNLSKMFSTEGLQSLFVGSPANDNGFGLIGDAVKAGAKEGTQAGAAGGIFAALKGQGGAISAGLGGLGMGYQSANPLMGGLGGALQGFASGGPIGAVIGGIAGVVGGLFGMNAELEKAKQKLNEARPALEKMMAAMDGEKISSYAAAFADYEKQVIEARALAWAAGDGDYARKLQDSFERLQGTMGKALNDEIERNILALSGMEYVNQAADALDQFNMRMKDAAFLLTDAPKAGEELTLTLQKIIDESKLTADQISDLAVRFPDLANALGMVKPYIDELVNGLSPERLFAMVEEANRAVESARSDLRTAYDAEARSLKEVIDRTRAFVSGLQQYRDGLRLDSNLSPLSQWERFQEAQRKFADVSQKALGGDSEAQSKLEGAHRDLITEAKAYYGNSEAFFAIFRDAEQVLDQVLAIYGGQLTETEKQFAALEKQVGLLGDINSGVMSVAQAIANLTNVMALQQAAQDRYNIGSGYSQDVLGLYRDVLGRAPDAQGAAYWQGKIAGGMTGAELYRQFIGTALGAGESPLTSAVAKWGIPGYASGTDFHPGGLARINEAGGEIFDLPRGTRVIPHDVSMRMASAANGNSSAELVRELQQLRQEVAQLRAERRQGDQIASSNVEATEKVAKAVNDGAREYRLSAARKM